MRIERGLDAVSNDTVELERRRHYGHFVKGCGSNPQVVMALWTAAREDGGSRAFSIWWWLRAHCLTQGCDYVAVPQCFNVMRWRQAVAI